MKHNKHYTETKHQPIDIIDDWDLDFYLGNVLKYIQRHRRKGAAMEDLEKASYYLKLKLERMKK